MPTITKRGKTYRAEVRVRGQRHSKTFATKREASAWALKIEAEIETPSIERSETVGAALERYSRDVSPTKKGARWEQVRLAQMGRDRLADIPIGRVTASDIAAWRDQRLQSVSSGSVNRELNLLSAVFERARREWGWMSANPVRDIQRPKNPRHRDRRISQDEIDRVLLALGYEEDGEVKTAQQQLAVAFLLSLETAMRLGEVLGLAQDSIFPERRFLRIYDSKNNDARDVPLSARAVELLAKIKSFTLSRDTASVLFARATKNAGIDNLRYHDSRHEAITRLARKLDVLDLARMVGHRDLRSLRIYYNATAEEIAGRLD